MSSPEIHLSEQTWNSLKIATMIVAAVAPVIIAFIVIRFRRTIKRLENKHQTNQEIVRKRMEIYDRMGPKLNDILCFYCYSGNWKSLSPVDIIRLKKELDKEINIYAPLFSDELSDRYNDFIQLCFVSFSGWEHKEKIKSLYALRQEHNADWKDAWIDYFDTKNVVDAIKMKEGYNELLGHFKKELNL